MRISDWSSDVCSSDLLSTKPLKIGVETFRGFVESWYDGSLSAIFFHPRKHEKIQRMICAVLAGYGWDLSNPYVGVGKRRLTALAESCRTGTLHEQDLVDRSEERRGGQECVSPGRYCGTPESNKKTKENQ